MEEVVIPNKHNRKKSEEINDQSLEIVVTVCCLGGTVDIEGVQWIEYI